MVDKASVRVKGSGHCTILHVSYSDEAKKVTKPELVRSIIFHHLICRSTSSSTSRTATYRTVLVVQYGILRVYAELQFVGTKASTRASYTRYQVYNYAMFEISEQGITLFSHHGGLLLRGTIVNRTKYCQQK